MDQGSRSVKWYGAVVISVLLVAAGVIPLVDGLNAAGFLGDKTYLLILQDNDEIRPTGGLMACMAVMTVHDAGITDLDVYYARTTALLNGSVQIEGPESASTFFGSTQTALFDSNMQYDFASFAPIMHKNFYQATGRWVDGIITVDFTTVKELLNVLGPVTAGGDTITSANVVGRLHYYSAISSGGKTPLTALVRALAFKLLQGVRDAGLPQKLTLLTTVERLGAEGHIQYYAVGNTLLRPFSGAREQPKGDFIAVVDMNVGVAKADFGINRTIDYDVTILPDGSTISNLTLTYVNNDFWEYKDLSTVLVPPDAEFIAVHNATDRLEGLVGKQVANSTAFSSGVVVHGNKTGSVTYTYKLPSVTSDSGVGTRYDLYVQKQAGIERYTVRIDVHVPDGTKVMASQNVGTTMTYTGDVHAFVVYT